MVFQSPVLIAGTDGVPGAIYRFANVVPNVDCTIEILGLYGGALLGEIDNTTQGYNDAWQPYVTAGANDTSMLEWRITFKVAGTNTDTVMPCVAITAVDCDGDGSQLKEYIQAATPGAYAVDPATTLSITFDGVYNRAIGSPVTIPLIDTFHREAMFQMNFANLSSIVYRNGSISTKDNIDVRHTCIYFKPFFYNTFILLPAKLLSLQATAKQNETLISWSVTDEKYTLQYAVQKSIDGINWTTIDQVTALNKGQAIQTYYSRHAGNPAVVTYYRLQQTDQQFNKTYSYIVYTGGNAATGSVISCPAIAAKQLPIRVSSAVADAYTIRIHSLQGQLLSTQQHIVQPGVSNLTVALPLSSTSALYVLSVVNRQGRVIYSSKILSR